MKRFLFCGLGLVLLCSCEAFTPADLDRIALLPGYRRENDMRAFRCQKIEISANVEAEVYYNGKKVGLTPITDGALCAEEERTFILKKEGMKDVALTVRQGTAEKEKRWTTSAYGRDFMWFSVGSVAGTVLLAASPLTTTTPCRTEICRRRLDAFPVRQEGRLIWLSTFFFVKDLVPQYYWQYAPAQYYVEMVPENERPLSIRQVRLLQSKKFLLDNFAQIQNGHTEYIETLSVLSFVPAETIKEKVAAAKTPALAAEKLSKEIERTAQLLKNISFEKEQTLLNTSLYLLRRFDDLKKGGKAERAELSDISGLRRDTLDDMIKHSNTPKEAVDNYTSLFFEITIARQAKTDRWKCKEPPKTCEAALRAALRESLKEDRDRLRHLTDYLAGLRADVLFISRPAPAGRPDNGLP